MFFLLVLLVVTVPFVELWIIVQVGREIGFLTTFAALVAVSIIGTALLRIEGFKVLRDLGDSVRRGELPSRELVHGACLVVSGILLLAPGFVTDVLGILLLLPPVRNGVAVLVTRRSSRRGVRRVTIVRTDGPASTGSRQAITVHDVVDIEEIDGTGEGRNG